MNFGSILFGKGTIGIDISDFSIEVLVLNRNREIVSYARELLPIGLIEKGEIKSVGKVSDALKRAIIYAEIADKWGDRSLVDYVKTETARGFSKDVLTDVLVKSGRSKKEIERAFRLIESLSLGAFKSEGGRYRSARVAFPKNKTYISSFRYNLQDVSKQEVERALRKEVSKTFAGFPDDFAWDYVISTSGKDKFDDPAGLYALADKKTAQAYASVMSLAGLKPFHFEIEPVSLARALLPEAIAKGEYTLIVDMGANTTSFYVFTPEGDLEYASNIEVGGEMITSQIAERKGVHMNDAESEKRKKGLNSDELKQVILDILAPVEKEIRFFLSRYENLKGGGIGRIILSGGSSLLPGLDAYFKQAFSKDVYIGNPFEKIKSQKEALANGAPPVLFANVIGLGLTGIARKYSAENIDLSSRIPVDNKPEKKTFIVELLILNAILMIVFVLVLLFT